MMTLCKSCEKTPYDHVIKQLFEKHGYANLRSTLDELLEDENVSK